MSWNRVFVLVLVGLLGLVACGGAEENQLEENGVVGDTDGDGGSGDGGSGDGGSGDGGSGDGGSGDGGSGDGDGGSGDGDGGSGDGDGGSGDGDGGSGDGDGGSGDGDGGSGDGDGGSGDGDGGSGDGTGTPPELGLPVWSGPAQRAPASIPVLNYSFEAPVIFPGELSIPLPVNWEVIDFSGMGSDNTATLQNWANADFGPVAEYEVPQNGAQYLHFISGSNGLKAITTKDPVVTGMIPGEEYTLTATIMTPADWPTFQWVGVGFLFQPDGIDNVATYGEFEWVFNPTAGRVFDLESSFTVPIEFHEYSVSPMLVVYRESSAIQWSIVGFDNVRLERTEGEITADTIPLDLSRTMMPPSTGLPGSPFGWFQSPMAPQLALLGNYLPGEENGMLMIPFAGQTISHFSPSFADGTAGSYRIEFEYLLIPTDVGEVNLGYTIHRGFAPVGGSNLGGNPTADWEAVEECVTITAPGSENMGMSFQHTASPNQEGGGLVAIRRLSVSAVTSCN